MRGNRAGESAPIWIKLSSGVALGFSLFSAGCAQDGSGFIGIEPDLSLTQTGSVGKQRGNASSRDVIAKARDLQANGSAKTAAQMLGQAFKKSPKDQELRRAYAIAALNAGNAETAYKLTTKLRKDEPLTQDPRLLSIRGAALSVLGKHDKAEQAFARALSLSPDDPDLMNNLGLALALKGDAKSAETLLRRVANSTKVDDRARSNLALVVGLQGRMAEATKISAAPRKATASPVATKPRAVAETEWITTTRRGLGGPSFSLAD